MCPVSPRRLRSPGAPGARRVPAAEPERRRTQSVPSLCSASPPSLPGAQQALSPAALCGQSWVTAGRGKRGPPCPVCWPPPAGVSPGDVPIALAGWCLAWLEGLLGGSCAPAAERSCLSLRLANKSSSAL